VGPELPYLGVTALENITRGHALQVAALEAAFSPMSISPGAASVPSPTDSGSPPAAAGSPEAPLVPPDRSASRQQQQQQQRSPLAPLSADSNRMETDQGESDAMLHLQPLLVHTLSGSRQDPCADMMCTGLPCSAIAEGGMVCRCD
jgi:hypothetical protein